MIFPLSAENRIRTGLHILKCGLIPFVPKHLKAHGIRPKDLLPPSSPILKHGFEPDARAALNWLSAKAELFFDQDDLADIRAQIRTLSRIRDQWAHQQKLTQTHANSFLMTGAALLESLQRLPEASAMRALAAPPPDFFPELQALLSNIAQDRFTLAEICLSLDLEPDDLSDLKALKSGLVWSFAIDLNTNVPPRALCMSDVNEISSLCWVLGLPHDAPAEIRHAELQAFLSELDQNN